MNKASGTDAITIELFQILKDDALKVLHSIYQQIWKTQQWLQDWKRSGFILIPKLSNWTITKYVCFLCHLPATAHRHRLCVPVCLVSRIQLFAPLWTVTHQAPLSMGFSRQVYWSGLPFPSPGDLPDPGIEPESPYLAGRFSTTEPPGKPYIGYGRSLNVITILWRILKLVVL